MHQTYYFDNSPEREPEAPAVQAVQEPVPPQPPAEEPPKAAGKRRAKKDKSEWGAILFLVLLVAVLGGTALLLALQAEPMDFNIQVFGSGQGSAGTVQLPQASQVPQNDLERVKAAAGVTLELVPPAEGEAKSLQTIYKEVSPSVVAVTAQVRMFSIQTFTYSGTGVAQGTGVVMSADGYVITNAHVIEDAFEAEITLADGTSYPAKLVGMDEDTDLAVLKIDAAGLTPAVFGSSDDMEVGDAVVAIGNPMGEELRGTMTDGILSAINRDMEVGGHDMTLLQTTAALNTGNSGGALVNDQGQVIGITNMKLVSNSPTGATVEGLGFAIPTSTVKLVVDSLLTHGHVLGRPTLGVTVQPLSPEEKTEQGLEHGLWVRAVEEKADAAGKLKEGDILLTANGRDLDTNQDLLEVRDTLEAGNNLYFQVLRDGETLSVTVKLMEQYQLEE